jgi:hypothetical protein
MESLNYVYNGLDALHYKTVYERMADSQYKP